MLQCVSDNVYSYLGRTHLELVVLSPGVLRELISEYQYERKKTLIEYYTVENRTSNSSRSVLNIYFSKTSRKSFGIECIKMIIY